MKKLIIFLSSISGLAQAENWVEVAQSNNAIYFIDIDSLTNNEAWVRMLYRTPEVSIGNRPVNYVISKQRFFLQRQKDTN